MGFLFAGDAHVAVRRRLIWNIGLIATATAANYVTVLAPTTAEGHVVRALLLSWLLGSLTLRLSRISVSSGHNEYVANVVMSISTLALIGGMIAFFFEASIVGSGLDLLSSFLTVIGIRSEVQADAERELETHVRNDLKTAYGILWLSAALWVSSDLAILVGNEAWQVAMLAGSTAAVVLLAIQTLRIRFPRAIVDPKGDVAVASLIVSTPQQKN